MAGALVCALSIVARTERLDPLTITFLALAGAGLLAASAFLWLSDRKQKAEVGAGYTTLAQGNNDVERLHSPTGVVMRAAGEPNLTKAQWEAAIAKVRSYRAAGQRSPAGLDSTQPAPHSDSAVSAQGKASTALGVVGDASGAAHVGGSRG
jgi:hypothetical protein